MSNNLIKYFSLIKILPHEYFVCSNIITQRSARQWPGRFQCALAALLDTLLFMYPWWSAILYLGWWPVVPMYLCNLHSCHPCTRIARLRVSKCLWNTDVCLPKILVTLCNIFRLVNKIGKVMFFTLYFCIFLSFWGALLVFLHNFLRIIVET